MKRQGVFIGWMTIVLGFSLVVSAWAGHHERPEKQGILLVAFGSTMAEAWPAFRNIEEEVREAFPGVPVRWAYTSHIVRRRMAEQGKAMDSLEVALARMMDEGFTHVAVQSLHTIGGWEFHEVARNARAFAGMANGFEQVAIGGPLLNGTEDIERVSNLLLKHVPKARKKHEAVVFMGHGTDHPANALYVAMMVALQEKDPKVLLGTVEGKPDLEDVLGRLQAQDVRKAYLIPFMAVAGDHARNDLAGEEEDSWKSVFTARGIDSEPVLVGTGEIDDFAAMWVDHLRMAVQQLSP